MTRFPGGYRVSVRQDLRPSPLSGTALKGFVLAALGCLRAECAEVRVRVVGDKAIARWNRDFLGRARPTNVISFPDDDRPAPGGKSVSGDIVVSAPTCLAQTQGWTESTEARVFFFVLHGMLHLAGYDHEAGGARARRMRRKELQLYRRVLAAVRQGNGTS
ncbi:MAG TPA: rRNA maturation RNase YbeY [Candidatus Deferrimicrobiaceae bacterium]